MTMEKYSQSDADLIAGLRDEEAQLMQKMATYMSNVGEKTAADQRTTEQRLIAVRSKITQIDLAKKS